MQGQNYKTRSTQINLSKFYVEDRQDNARVLIDINLYSIEQKFCSTLHLHYTYIKYI